MPEGAVYVGRPTRWGNPHRIDPERPESRVDAVRRYRDDLLAGRLRFTVDDVRAELAGRDLVCWCRLDQACHADVLLDVANSSCP